VAIPTSDPGFAASLLCRVEELQTGAGEVTRILDLMAMLAALGQPRQVGSSVSGLMVRGDIDVTVRYQDVTLKWVRDALRRLLINPQIKRLNKRGPGCPRSA